MLNRRSRFDSTGTKDYQVLLSDRVWPSVEKKLLAGIRNDTLREQTKTVLANTRKTLLADTYTGTQSISYLPKLVLPLVRRLFPQLIAQNII